jgi:hypothetical protein
MDSREMPMWVWVGIGIGSFLLVSATVTLAVARILGTIAAKVAHLQETDDWAMLPPARASEERKDVESEHGMRAAGARPR